MLYGHGDDQIQKTINFSTNVWFEGPDKKLIEHLKTALSNIGSYPEVTANSLCNKLAQFHNISPDQVIIGNGATEIFYLVAQVFSGAKSLIYFPSFSEYEDSCTLYNHKLFFRSLTSLTPFEKTEADIVWIGNPNNPDGSLIASKDLYTLIKNNPKTVFIVDEAYMGFTLEHDSLVKYINELNNLIVVTSLTKYYSIPGLRLGYACGNSNLIEKLYKAKQPWTNNNLAIEAGNFILDNPSVFMKDMVCLHNLKTGFVGNLSAIEGISVRPSHTHYFLVELSKPDSLTLKKYLLENYGILIRDASNFRGLSNRFIRLATLSETDNIKLVNCLKEWMNS